MKAQNSALQQQIRRLKKEREHISNLVQVYESEKQHVAVKRENQKLMKDIEKILTDVLQARSSLKETYKNNHDLRKLFSENGEKLAQMSKLKKENKELKAQISGLNDRVEMRKALKKN